MAAQTYSRMEGKGMKALLILTDLLEDPKDNGEYELHIKGDDLKSLKDL